MFPQTQCVRAGMFVCACVRVYVCACVRACLDLYLHVKLSIIIKLAGYPA